MTATAVPRSRRASSPSSWNITSPSRIRAGELAEAIRTVAAGERLLSPTITRRLIEQHLRRPAPGKLSPALAALTHRELDVLKLLARGLSNTEIAERLYLGTSTIKTHVNRILTKLDLRDRAQAVVYAYETGLIQPGETDTEGPDT